MKEENNFVKNKDAFDEMLVCVDSAEKIFIVTSSSIQQEEGAKRTEELTKKLLKNLGVYPKSKKNPKTQYWFLFPSYEIANGFWEKLIEKARLSFAKTNDSWIEKRLNFLESNHYLQVYIVPSFVCSFHQTIFNPDNTRNAVGFSCDYSSNIMEALRWDPVSIVRWKKNVYERFQWRNPKTNEPFAAEADALNFMKENPKYFAGYLCPLVLNSGMN